MAQPSLPRAISRGIEAPCPHLLSLEAGAVEGGTDIQDPQASSLWQQKPGPLWPVCGQVQLSSHYSQCQEGPLTPVTLA